MFNIVPQWKAFVVSCKFAIELYPASASLACATSWTNMAPSRLSVLLGAVKSCLHKGPRRALLEYTKKARPALACERGPSRCLHALQRWVFRDRSRQADAGVKRRMPLRVYVSQDAPLRFFDVCVVGGSRVRP